MWHSMASEARQRGFTLVEVMCAIAIAAMAVVFLLRGVTGSGTAAVTMEDHLGARILARSILDIERGAETPKTGSRSGETGMYRWQLDVVSDGATRAYAPRGWRFYRATVQVAWGERGHLQLDTVRLGK